MSKPKKYVQRTCTIQQSKGATGISLQALLAYAIAGELSMTLCVPLRIGVTIGLGLAGISATMCFFTTHIQRRYKGGSGILCEECQMPALLGTEHCDICEICVPAYSHHSDWLNACIGGNNYLAYLLCLMSIGEIAICQLIVSTTLLALIATDEKTALRILDRYSLYGQGYIFHTFLLFYFLISLTLAATTWASFGYHLLKAISLWKDQRKGRTQVKPVRAMKRPNPSSDTGVPVISSVSMKVQSESFDSHAEDVSGIADSSKCGVTQVSYQLKPSFY